MSNLTAKQEKFVQGLVAGLSQREAYKQSYDSKKMKDNTIDRKAFNLTKDGKIRARYEELMNEHKEKALWTREKAVSDLIWIKDKARESVSTIGIDKANSGAFISAIKELNTLEDLYPKAKDNTDEKESAVAAMLRKLAGDTNGK